MASRSSQAAIESGTEVVGHANIVEHDGGDAGSPSSGWNVTSRVAALSQGADVRQSRDIDHPACRGPVGEALQPVRNRVQGEPLAHQGLGHSIRGEP